MTSTRRSLASLIVLIVTLVPTFDNPAWAQADDDTNAIDDMPHITIVGSALAQVAPDLATITVGVTSEKPALREASDETARLAQAVVAAARARGVGEADITTQGLTLTQTFDEARDASGRYIGQTPRGFAAAETFAIKIRDLPKAGALAQSLIDAGATTFDGIAFSVEFPEPILDRLAAEAVRNARRRAQLIAEAVGVRLGPVLLVERPSADRAALPVFATRTALAAPTMPVKSAMPIEPGSTNISSEMEVTWSIER